MALTDSIQQTGPGSPSCGFPHHTVPYPSMPYSFLPILLCPSPSSLQLQEGVYLRGGRGTVTGRIESSTRSSAFSGAAVTLEGGRDLPFLHRFRNRTQQYRT